MSSSCSGFGMRLNERGSFVRNEVERLVSIAYKLSLSFQQLSIMTDRLQKIKSKNKTIRYTV